MFITPAVIQVNVLILQPVVPLNVVAACVVIVGKTTPDELVVIVATDVVVILTGKVTGAFTTIVYTLFIFILPEEDARLPAVYVSVLVQPRFTALVNVIVPAVLIFTLIPI